MIVHYILCSVFLFIPSIYSINETLPKTNKTAIEVLSPDKTKLPLHSGGGTILPDKSVLTSKDNITADFLNLEEGFGKAKEKPVHARKGVNLLDDDPKNNMNIDLNTLDRGSSPMSEKSNSYLKKPGNYSVNLSTDQQKNLTLSKELPKAAFEITKLDQAKVSEMPKKPTKTVYETLASLSQGPVTAKTSAHTLILDQIPSPKKDPNIGKNPGMITPIIITILIVPMFAVLGYMALRRGQEAWKNRHYKRMDFLLDGMYND